MQSPTFGRSAAFAVVTTLLASCGGGGGGDTPAPSPTATTAPATSVSSSSYAAGSALRMAYDQLNASRQRCGFGLLAQSGPLDQSASAHANYMARNGVFAHEEDPSKPGFTGATPIARAAAAGYTPGTVGEDLATGGTFFGSTAADSIRNLLAAPYHAQSLLAGFRDVGLGWMQVAGSDTLVVDLGAPRGTPLQAPQGVATFPCAGTTDGVPRNGNESPAPFADPNAVWGQPITIAGPQSLQVTSASVTGPSGPVRLLAVYGPGQTPDPNGEFTSGWATVIPDVLQPNTSYSVAIDYTAAGAPGSVRFTFATGAH